MRPLLSRRALLLAGASAGGAGCFRLARPFPNERPLSPLARRLIARAWAGVDARKVLDAHVHVVGLGKGGTGCWVNPVMQTPLSHPIAALRFDIYKQAAGVVDEERGDAQYVETLVSRIRRQLQHGRFLALAFDQTYAGDGTPRPELTEFHTPNAYVARLAREYPDCFVACASVHPYRKDAVEALEAAVADGAVAVKWLPNAMYIDPSSPRCDAFYEALKRLEVPLLTHAGEEKAVEAEEAQRYGNPLHLRRPLDAGVKVIVAHCASLGQNPDLDAPGRPWVDNFDLFARLMAEKRYEGLLYGDVSAMAQANRVGPALSGVLKRREWHPRLLNGSDYPLPAITVLVQTRVLKERGFLSADERDALNELDRHNPLLFDFVLKRTMAWREDGATYRLPPPVFETPAGLFPRLKPA